MADFLGKSLAFNQSELMNFYSDLLERKTQTVFQTHVTPFIQNHQNTKDAIDILCYLRPNSVLNFIPSNNPNNV